MPFQVIFDGRAECDIHNYERRFAKMSNSILKRWRTRLLKTIHILESDPQRFPESYEAEALNLPLRDAYFGRFPHLYRLVFVMVDSDRVHILRVRHSAQDWISQDDL
jgi:plasmid stabilization system protein ParE